VSLEIKAFLISIPIAILITVLLIVLGFYVIGKDWSMTGFPFISLLTGLIAYFSVKKQLIAKNKATD